jgi:hypothetical protein
MTHNLTTFSRFSSFALEGDIHRWKITVSYHQPSLGTNFADTQCIPRSSVTGDEKWDYSYDAVTNQQFSHWMSPALPCPMKARQVCS